MTKIRYNIRRIKPHTSDTHIEDVKSLELIIGEVTLENYQLYTYVFTLNLGTRYSNRIHMGNF